MKALNGLTSGLIGDDDCDCESNSSLVDGLSSVRSVDVVTGRIVCEEVSAS